MAIGVLRANFTGLVLVSGVVIGSIELVGTGLGSVLQDLVFLQVGCAVPDATVGGVHSVLLPLDEGLGSVNCDGELLNIGCTVLRQPLGVNGSLGDHDSNITGGAALGLAQHPVAAGVGIPLGGVPIVVARHGLNVLGDFEEGEGLIDEERAASPGVRSNVGEEKTSVVRGFPSFHFFESSRHQGRRIFQLGIVAVGLLDGDLLLTVQAKVEILAELLALGVEDAVNVEFAPFHLGQALNESLFLLFAVNGGRLADDPSIYELLFVDGGESGIARVQLHTGGGLSAFHAGTGFRTDNGGAGDGGPVRPIRGRLLVGAVVKDASVFLVDDGDLSTLSSQLPTFTPAGLGVASSGHVLLVGELRRARVLSSVGGLECEGDLGGVAVVFGGRRGPGGLPQD
mmetsp:Transcript_4304/g.8032  ORF Transcript_4304/g.8032 Transcript_4304/m.8032 type:complete len:398 (-) Transcript_4304:715-1908(-)